MNSSNLETRVLEIRDAMTHIPALAVRMLAQDETQAYYIHRRCGYSPDGSSIILIRLSDGNGENDPYSWCSGTRTMTIAHNYIVRHFAELKDGDVVDVEFLLGLRDTVKVSERIAAPEL